MVREGNGAMRMRLKVLRLEADIIIKDNKME